MKRRAAVRLMAQILADRPTSRVYGFVAIAGRHDDLAVKWRPFTDGPLFLLEGVDEWPLVHALAPLTPADLPPPGLCFGCRGELPPGRSSGLCNNCRPVVPVSA